MFKVLIFSFVLLSFILVGCSSTSPEPQVIEETIADEETMDLEHVKKIEEEERKQEDKAAEFLEEEETAATASNSEEVENAQTVVTQNLAEELPKKNSDPSTQEIVPDSSSNDSQIVAEDSKQLEAQQESEEVATTEPNVSADTATNSALETIKAALPINSAETAQVVSANETQVDQTATVAVIVAPDNENTTPLFMPDSTLALVTALKLVSCKNVPARMETVYQRLLKTKDLNIADRRLRDKNNDSLMPVIHFDFDQINIKSVYKKLLRQQSTCVMKALEAHGKMIVQIEGHADERGSDEYNIALGHRRANAIANSIMAYLPNSALARILSYGEEFPLDKGSKKSSWDKNRRVEFTLLLKP